MRARIDIVFSIDGTLRFEISTIRADGSTVVSGTSTESVGDALMQAIAGASSVGDSEGLIALALMTKFREVLGPGKQPS